jgi:catalase
MVESSSSPGAFKLGPLLIIATVVGVAAVAFAYTAGWLSPQRLTPKKIVAALAPPGGPALGHRRNHAKGICFTGTFEANGAGSSLSKAQVFVSGQYPIVGRFNLATADPNAADAMVRVRGIGIQITTPDGQEWRSAMISAPIFPVSTPQGFYELLTASGSKDPNAMKNFITAHPEFTTFLGWAKAAPWTGSYAEERYNSLNSFLFVNSRWGASFWGWHSSAWRCA